MIEIVDRTNGGKMRRYATPINEWLCIVALEQGYMIYKTQSGKPFIDTTFRTKELAKRMAYFLDEVYGEYFLIWETPGWEQADVILLFQYTVPNGEKIYQTVQNMKGHIVGE